MSVRLLVTACDWRILSAASGSFADEGYDVMVESSPEKALTLAESWQPDVIVLSSLLLARWDRRLPDAVEQWFPRTRFIVTVQLDDDDRIWEQFYSRGFELLPLPLLHPGEFVSAVKSTVEQGSGGERSKRGSAPLGGGGRPMSKQRPDSEMRRGTA